MAETQVRTGYHTITPYLTARDASGLLEFVKRTFGAEELVRTTGSAGGMHAEVRIGDSVLMIGGGGAWEGEPTSAMLYVYVDDVDAVYQRAQAEGATMIEEPADQPYGERRAGWRDAFGNQWYVAAPIANNAHDKAHQ